MLHLPSLSYTDQLLKLDGCRAPYDALPQLKEVSTPVVLAQWESMLRSHPDRRFTEFLLHGISRGFRVGYNYNKKLKALGGNLPSAYQNPEVVSKYIKEEVAQGRVLGLLCRTGLFSSYQPVWSHTKEAVTRKVASDGRPVQPR